MIWLVQKHRVHSWTFCLPWYINLTDWKRKSLFKWLKPFKWPFARDTGQAGVEVVKIKNPDFSCWAWSTPWGLVLSLKSFCRNPVLSWAIRYSVFQPVKLSSSFEFVCRTIFSTFGHLVVKFGYNKGFLSNKKVAFFRFGEISVK